MLKIFIVHNSFIMQVFKSF